MRVKGSTSLTVEEIAKAKSLSALGYSYRRVARELGRNPRTIKRVLTQPEVIAEVKELKTDLADLYEKLTLQTLESIGMDTIEEASLLQRATTAGIFTDKFRLLRGESTANLNVELLLQIAGTLRQEDDNYVPRPAQHTLTLPPVPQTEPASDPIPAPQPAKIQQPTVAHVRYTPVPANPHPDHCPESVLLHGLNHGR